MQQMLGHRREVSGNEETGEVNTFCCSGFYDCICIDSGDRQRATGLLFTPCGSLRLPMLRWFIPQREVCAVLPTVPRG